MFIQKPAGKILVGLTGSFGSGKSTAAKFFQDLGACVLEADDFAKEALRPQEKPYDQLVASWGKKFLTADGQVDRKKIADLIFSDGTKRRELESWVHPYVFSRMEKAIRESPKKVMVLDVPLLFESGFHVECDWTLTVQSNEAAIQNRLLKKGFSAQEIKSRLRCQMTQEEKIKRSDFVIHNDSTLEALKREVLQVWEKITR